MILMVMELLITQIYVQTNLKYLINSKIQTVVLTVLILYLTLTVMEFEISLMHVHQKQKLTTFSKMVTVVQIQMILLSHLTSLQMLMVTEQMIDGMHALTKQKTIMIIQTVTAVQMFQDFQNLHHLILTMIQSQIIQTNVQRQLKDSTTSKMKTVVLILQYMIHLEMLTLMELLIMLINVIMLEKLTIDILMKTAVQI